MDKKYLKGIYVIKIIINNLKHIMGYCSWNQIL